MAPNRPEDIRILSFLIVLLNRVAIKGDRIIKSTPSGITAISLEVVDGGIMDGVSIDNIVIEGTECPLYVRLANRGRKYIDEAPVPPIGKNEKYTD